LVAYVLLENGQNMLIEKRDFECVTMLKKISM
jgi:hypothetical protein